MTLVTTFCYGIVVSSFLKKPFRETRKSTTASVLVLTGAAVLLATSIIMIKLPEDGFASRWKLEAGNQITQELVDAFENKQVNLLKEPTEQLINMEIHMTGVPAIRRVLVQNGIMFIMMGSIIPIMELLRF